MRRRASLGAAGLGLIAMMLLTVLPGASASGWTQSANLTATRHGVTLAQNPLLQPGDVVQLVGTGFARGAPVTERLAGSAAGTHLKADGQGVLHFTYRVPAYQPKDAYLLTFAGDPPAGSSLPPPVASGPGDHQDVIVTVPNVGFFPYRVDPGATGTPSPSTTASISASATSTSGGSHGAGGIAYTGVDVAALVVIALVFMVPGVVAAIGGRRRSRPEH